MKKQRFHRIISCILVLVMLLGMVPMLNISAAEVTKAQIAESTGTTDDGFVYSVTDEEVTITAYNGSETELIIPGEISGYPVISIGDEAFSYCSSIISVTIPDGVESIGTFAFGNCAGLESVSIPKSVMTMGDEVFSDCYHLSEVIFEENTALESISDFAFANCYSLIAIVIPDGVQSIGEYAFNYCDVLESVAIPTSVTNVGEYAFDDCKSLTEVYYNGTQEQWNQIFFAGFNTDLLNAKLNFVSDDEDEPAEHVLIYFVDTLNWEDITLYYEYLDDETVYTRDMEWDSVNEYGEKMYIQSVPGDADVMYFASSNGENTVFIYGITDGICYYCTEEIAPDVYNVDIYSDDTTDSYEPVVEYVTGSSFESDHDYASNTDKTWIIEAEGATSITITFSADTYVEEDWDFIFIYDENDDLIGEYTGDTLASQSVTVRGNVAKVQLLADSSNEYYGFSAEYAAGYGEDVTDPTEPETSPTEPDTEPPTEAPTEPTEAPDFGIDIGSEIFDLANVGDTVRYTVELRAQDWFEDFEATLTYNSDCLELVRLFDEDGEDITDMYDIGTVMCPNLYDPFVNSTEPGVIRFFDVNVDGNDFTQGNILLTLEFVVKDTSYSQLCLLINELTILGGEDSYFADGEAVTTEGISITKSIEITEFAPEPTQPGTFTVVFLDHDSKFISVQLVSEGAGAIAPDDPQRKGYTFTGWDTEFDTVYEDLVVYAMYTKNAQSPVQTPTTGNLKVEVAGGKGFEISIDGGAFRAQGASYLNSQISIGAQVTVKATTVADSTFVGWVNPYTGIIMSSDLVYNFTASGNDFIKAMYIGKVEGVQVVTFKNDKSNRILDSQYYSADEAINFPTAPTQVGYDFAGWSMTEAEIKASIANGQDVTVVALWTKQLVYINVTVTNGTGGGRVLANNALTVTANAAPAGQKFAYWTDAAGNIKSYNESYKFYPSSDMEIIAVFVAEDAVVEQEILVSVDTIDTTSIADKNVFYFSWYVPTEYEFVKAGILAVNKDNYNEDAFVSGTSDDNVYDRSPSTALNNRTGSASWNKSNVTEGQTWVAKAYVQYYDDQGNIVTVYSDMVEATKA